MSQTLVFDDLKSFAEKKREEKFCGVLARYTEGCPELGLDVFLIIRLRL